MNTLPTDLELIDSRAVKRMFGIRSNDTLRKRHSKQLLPEPILRGQKKFWPMQECQTLLAAEINGLDNDEMQALVVQLSHKRSVVFLQLKDNILH